MNINTAQTESQTPKNRSARGALHSTVAAVALLLVSLVFTQASTVLGPWVPMFKGVDHAVGTNTAAGGGFPDLMVVHFMRIDLTDPDIRFYASPRITNYVLEYTETAGYTMTNFLKNHGLQVAVNANGFFQPGSTISPSYTLPEGTAFNVTGLLISQGQQVSSQVSAEDSSVLMFATNNAATFIPTNWPPQSTSGIYTAVAGGYSVLVNGVNVGSNYIGNGQAVHGLEPRTLLGLSQDRHYLYLLTIDGRQPGYSVGAYDWEAAAWLLRAGAWDGSNMDGGGSTCLVIMDSTGKPVALNRDSASVSSGRERTLGAHFGVYAAPLPGFFTNVAAWPDDTAAAITWKTTNPSTTQVRYGLTTNLNLTSTLNSALVTNHSALLTNLTPGTGYYFAAVSTIGSTQYVSSNYFFVTTNYLTTNTLFDFTNSWKFTTANLDGTNWAARTYNDSAWEGQGPGLLWADNRGPNTDIPLALNTEMPTDPGTTYPYRTYYLRTHFPFADSLTGVSLQFQDYIDDGAVFYLNGTELYRLRMPAAPTQILNATLANGYACTGDATCPDNLSFTGPIVTTNLLAGDNVLAVEVHNYNAGSPDITFGLAATYTEPYTTSPKLSIVNSNGTLTLSWARNGFILQQANGLLGPWTDVPGPVFLSPFSTNTTAAALYFRLRK